MESEQDRNIYRENGKNTGISLGYDIPSGKVSGLASAGKSHTDSHYESVINQAGIYAGDKGFDITVKDKTYLKGAVIDSKGSADKNTLRTGTLSWENIENKADYTSGGSGISYTAKLGGSVNKDTPSSKENSRYDKEPGTNTHNESDKVTRAGDGNRIPLNERGLLGVPSAATKGKADSTTRAAIAPGKIVITDTKNQKQDVTGLDRNTRDSLNKLKTIFDKTKAEERKQLVEEMSIVGNEAIHELAARNGWGEGSIEKTALHGLLGAMTSKAAGSSAITGILSGGVQEYAMGYLHNHMPKGWAANHPDEAQMIAAGLGMIVGSISNDKKIGGYIAQMGAKWNGLTTEDQEYNELNPGNIEGQLAQAVENGDPNKILEALMCGYELSSKQKDVPEYGENDFIFTFNQANRILGTNYQYNEDYGMTANLKNAIIIYQESRSDRDALSLHGGFGLGIGDNVIAGPLEGGVQANTHIEFSTDRPNPVIVSAMSADIAAAGISAEYSFNPKLGTGTGNIKGHGILGNASYRREDNNDNIISIGVQKYFIIGGEFGIDINLTKINEMLTGKSNDDPNSKENIDKKIKMIDGKGK